MFAFASDEQQQDGVDSGAGSCGVSPQQDDVAETGVTRWSKNEQFEKTGNYFTYQLTLYLE